MSVQKQRSFSKRLFSILASISFLAMSAPSQGTPSLSTDEVRYFVSFFERIGSADVDVKLLANNEAAVGKFYRLNAAESALLHSAAQAYRTEMTRIRNSEKATLAARSKLNDSDRASIAQLVQARNQMVAELAANVLGSVRTETGARLLVHAQETMVVRAARGMRSREGI